MVCISDRRITHFNVASPVLNKRGPNVRQDLYAQRITLYFNDNTLGVFQVLFFAEDKAERELVPGDSITMTFTPANGLTKLARSVYKPKRVDQLRTRIEDDEQYTG